MAELERLSSFPAVRENERPDRGRGRGSRGGGEGGVGHHLLGRNTEGRSAALRTNLPVCFSHRASRGSQPGREYLRGRSIVNVEILQGFGKGERKKWSTVVCFQYS